MCCYVSKETLTPCNSVSGYLTYRLAEMDAQRERKCECEAIFTLIGMELGYAFLALISLVETAVRLPLLLLAPLGALMVCCCVEINWDDVVVLASSSLISLQNAVRCLFAMTTNICMTGRDYAHLTLC